MSQSKQFGVSLEQQEDSLTKEQQKHMRRRSRQLLGSLLRPYTWKIVLLTVLVSVSQGAAAISPMLIAHGIDVALPRLVAGAPESAYWTVGAYIGAGVTRGIMMAWFVVLTGRVSQYILYELRHRLFAHTQRLSLEFHEKYTSGKIISRQTNDLAAIRALLDTGFSDLVAGVFFLVFLTIAIVILDPISALVLFGSIVPLIILLRWFQKRSSVLYRESTTRSARLVVKFVETMTGIRAVQAFRQEPENAETYARLNEEYRQTNKKTFRVFGVLFVTMTIVGNTTIAVLVLVNGLRVLNGDIGVGVLLAAVLYAQQFFGPLDSIAMFYNTFQGAAAALEKISGVLEEENSVPDPESPKRLVNPRGDIHFTDVEFGYGDGVTVLPKFSLDIPRGQTVALVGQTGAGKTTIAKLLARFYDPTAGQVSLDGIDLRDLHPEDRHRAIVMVTQESYLFSGTIAENIAIGNPDASGDEIIAAAKAAGVHEFIAELPEGYNTDVNKRGGRLSSGQRQLVSFARAFLANPAVLILDEATSSLDIPSERAVQQALSRLLADRTAIIIAHRLSTVAIADRVLVLEKGRVLEDDTPQALIAKDGHYGKLHRAWQESLS